MARASVTLGRIAGVHDARPFVPFDIVLDDGGRIHVPHPEVLAHPRKGRVIVVFDENGIARSLDLLLVSRLEVGTGGRGGGAGRGEAAACRRGGATVPV